jgi:hypothetical protein
MKFYEKWKLTVYMGVDVWILNSGRIDGHIHLANRGSNKEPWEPKLKQILWDLFSYLAKYTEAYTQSVPSWN